VRVSPEHFPVLVTGNKRDLFDREAGFEKAARTFVSKIVKMKIIDFQFPTLTAKCRPNRASVVWEDSSLADI
jgi:hypothetical protein